MAGKLDQQIKALVAKLGNTNSNVKMDEGDNRLLKVVLLSHIHASMFPLLAKKEKKTTQINANFK